MITLNYSNYTLEQINEYCKNYMQLCNMFLKLSSSNNVKEKLKHILYDGGYGDFGFDTDILNKNNPIIEMKRRISMANLLITNPGTFDILAENKINLFHGTNANALPSILKYGLNSGSESERMGIYVSTGEKWSRVNSQRNFVSFTDILDIACEYSSIEPDNKNYLSFEVIVGTTIDNLKKEGLYKVMSGVPEVGVKNRLSLEGIKLICVPSDKVEFVRKLIGDNKIIVAAIDDIYEKFYYVDDFGIINISYEQYNNLKFNMKKNRKIFKLEELKNMFFSKMFGKYVLNDTKLNEGENNYENRKHK